MLLSLSIEVDLCTLGFVSLLLFVSERTPELELSQLLFYQ